MLHEPEKCSDSIELTFDVTERSGPLSFLGLLDRLGESDNELTGLFGWICQACGASNRDTAVVKPQQSFRATWSCGHCSQTTTVQFRARAVAEWIAQHTAAITEKTSDIRATGDARLMTASIRRRPTAHGGQRILAWIAVPALIGIITLELLDVVRTRSSSACPPRMAQEQLGCMPSSRLAGCWVSQAGDHLLSFDPIDMASRTGTYTIVRRGQRQSGPVRFRLIHQEPVGEQLVIREEADDPAGASAGGLDFGHDGSDVTISIPRHGRSMTRVDIRDGQPIVTVYHNAANARMR